MKIEMGESIIYSWLRHVKECQIVETNWKPSPNWTVKNQSKLDGILKATLPLFANVFKNRTTTVDSLLRQAECDAFGMFIENGKLNIHACDVAFHTDGLNYNTKTTEKVVEKCIRTAICIYAYFNIEDCDIYFASPTCSPRRFKSVYNALNQLQTITDGLGYHFRFKLIVNDEFKNEIVNPIIGISGKVSNGAELWLRAYQLLDLFDINSSSASSKVTNKKTTHKASITKAKSSGIGAYAKVAIKNAIESGKVSAAEVTNLQDAIYCKNTFNLNYPVLVDATKSYPTGRYYVFKSTKVTFNGKDYVITNDWYENRHRVLLENWIKSH